MKPKRPAKRIEGVLRRAHDLRRLRPCAICGGVGLVEDMAGFDAGTLVHLSCYFETFGEAKFLKLPEVDLRKTRVSDVPFETMEKLLKGKV